MNKFRSQVGAEQPPPKKPGGEPQIGFEGFHSELSARVLPLGSAAAISHMRIEKGALRKDFGWEPVGTAAPDRILALTEHKFVSSNQVFQRLIRIFREDSKARIQVWNGATWIDAALSDEPINDVMLSTLSIQGSFLVADGSKILRWGEDQLVTDVEQDFPSGNLLEDEGDETVVIVSPGDSVNSKYLVHYTVNVTGPTPPAVPTGLEIEVALLLNGTEIMSVVHSYDPEEIPIVGEQRTLKVTASIADSDSLTLQLKRVDGGAAASEMITNPFSFVSDEWVAPKGPDMEAWDDIYTYSLALTIAADREVGFWYDRNDGASWQLLEYVILPFAVWGGASVFINFPYEIDDMGTAGAKFKVEIIAPGGIGVGEIVPQWVNWVPPAATNSTANVHGNNKVIDIDPTSGLTYTLASHVVSVFELLSPDATGARYIFSFGDRVIALQDDGDRQILAWCVDGVIDDWAGVGSGRDVLLDTRIDPIDDLMSGAPIGEAVAALYRRRSIMRIVETGNEAHAISAVHWLEGIGTESPFSVQVVPGGNIFLGSDRMVYYLSSGGDLVPIGTPIVNELVRALSINAELVDSAYDSVLDQYWLSIPEVGAGNCTCVWIFDFGQFHRSKTLEWRRRPFHTQRLAVVSDV